MPDRYFILIDATPESQAPFFARSPVFQPWLRSVNNIPEALEFIRQIELPYSINVYLARDNTLDDGLPADTTGEIRTLIQTLCDLDSVLHLTVYCPEINTTLEQQFRSVIRSPRLIKAVISVVSLHAYMCREGISYFEEEQNRCLATNQAHLTRNLGENIDELMAYLKKLIQDRKKIHETLVEEHSNKPSEESS
jgi:hypothetical protein